MTNIYSLLKMTAAVAVLAASVACSSEHDEPEPPKPDFVTFDGDVSEIVAPPTGGDVVLTFTTNKDWELEMLVNNAYRHGMPLQRTGEAGENRVIFKATANTGSAERSTPIKITAGRATGQITIRQNAIPIELPSEDEVKAYLLRLFKDTDGPNWRFKLKWDPDLPLSKWGSEVHYNNGLLDLYLSERDLNGKIDLSGCKALVSIRCSKNRISELDLSDCPLLTYVDCTNSGLERIDVTGCHSLDWLSVPYNSLRDIDVGWSKSLVRLYVEVNRLEKLDLSQCVSLKNLNCQGNRLKELDIPLRQQLVDLFCYNNELSSLDVSSSPQLSLINCGDNELTSFNISGCPRLDMIYCYNNRLTRIDTHEQKDILRCLYCYSNRLTEMDMSGYRNLGELHCSDNDLETINLTGCRNLRWLYCSHNRIESLDFTDIDPHMFIRLDCSYNRLRHLDLTVCTRLFHLWCQGNRIGWEIPEWCDRLEDFEYDVRYEYRPDTGTFTDRGYGWWYPGEPEKMAHRRD